MSHSVSLPEQKKNRISWLKIVGYAALAVLLLALLLGGGVYLWFRSALNAARPTLDGTVQVAGLKAPVSVVRDGHGVPTITATAVDDLLFAQGYVTAEDRLWQMDMMRRYAAGDLAAALGADMVSVDRKQRVLGLREVARRSLAEATPEQREQLEAYARGVNAYIAEHQFGLPLEMRVLRYFPRAWTAEDSLLVGASMAEMLNNEEYTDELGREKILAKLGPELTADLYVERSQRDIAPGHDLDEIEPEASAPDTAQKNAVTVTRHRHRQKKEHTARSGGDGQRGQLPSSSRAAKFQGFRVSWFQR